MNARLVSVSTKADFHSLIKRRRALALASTAIGLAGCGMLPSSSPSSASTSAPAADRQAVAEKVNAYEADIVVALDKVDRDRLRAAAGKQPLAAATAPSQAPVILASAGGTTAAPPSNTAAAHAAEPAHVGTLSAPVSPVVSAAPQALEPANTVAPTGSAESPAAAAHIPLAPTVADKPVEKAASPTTEKPAVQATADVTAAPLSSDSAAIHSDVITMVAAPPAAPVSAMSAMNAVASVQATTALPAAAVTGAPDAPEASVEDALAILKKNVGAHPTLSTSLALALLDSGSATDAVKGLSEADQKVFNDLLGALDTMKTADAGATLSDRAAPLLDAAKKWQAAADLSLPRLVLASRVDSFGVFTAMDPVFEQGKRHTVIIYCEVANFASQKGTDGWYTTHLTQQETLMTEDKLLVWRPNAEDVEDRSLNQRHDFYLVKKLTIPENLAAGKYTLIMNVTDKVGDKKNIVTLPIEIK